ncbi:MAG: DUF996 domain-containing protein [Candidatus Hodarchaeales archaeon]
MTFESSKNLSAIGSLLIVIGLMGSVVPYAGILSVVGIILLLIGLKGLSGFYQEEGIFNNALYAMITAIVGVVAAGASLVITAVSVFATIGIDINDPNAWATLGTDIGNYFSDFANFSELMTIIGGVVIALLVIFIAAIISMYFYRKSLNQLSSKSGIGLFGTAGLLMLIGAVLTIVAIGLLLIWIGFIIATVAFFKMKKE